MNLIEQFLSQNLTKDLNHNLLSQIQSQNSALQTLVSNLEALRDNQNPSLLQNKLNRIQAFLQLKKIILTTLQPLHANKTPVFDWVLNSLVHNSFLYELIKREQFFVQKSLIDIGKRTLLQENYLQQHQEDHQFAHKIIKQLHLIKSQRSQGTKVLNREKIKEIDNGIETFEKKIKVFEQKVTNFNTQMLLFLRRIYSFDEKIRNQFYQDFTPEPYQAQPPQNDQQNENIVTRQNSQKSHISINSQNQQSLTKIIKPKQYYENQRTPRKFLQTQVFQHAQRIQPDSTKSQIDKRRSTLDEKRSLHNMKSSFYQNRGSYMQNQRSSINYRRPSQKYQSTLYQDELRNMNKTLNAFNHYKPERDTMLYTTSNLGQQIRLPSKWTENSRSSLSYYPHR